MYKDWTKYVKTRYNKLKNYIQYDYNAMKSISKYVEIINKKINDTYELYKETSISNDQRKEYEEKLVNLTAERNVMIYDLKELKRLLESVINEAKNIEEKDGLCCVKANPEEVIEFENKVIDIDIDKVIEETKKISKALL